MQHIAQARGPLGTLRDHAPGALLVTRQVKSHDVQALATGRLHAVQRAQVAGVAIEQRRRQQTFVQQALRALQVGQHGFQKRRALAHTGFDLRPVMGFYQQGQ